MLRKLAYIIDGVSMASIVLTDKCNLKCSYCFANEFTNKNFNEITIENFKKAVDFCITEGEYRYYRCDYENDEFVALVNSFSFMYESPFIEICNDDKGEYLLLRNPVNIKLAGGEPLLHSKFDELLRLLFRNELVSSVTIYTNGVNIDKYIDLFKNPKCSFLINCNSPEIIGEVLYNKILANIKLLVDSGLKNKFSIGYNIYDIKADYHYILKLLVEFSIKSLRTSIVCPDFKRNDFRLSEDNFYYFKEYVLGFVEKLFDIDVVPYFDCNVMPLCYLEFKDYYRFRRFLKNKYFYKRLKESDLLRSYPHCIPIIDIYWDLSVSRCLLLSFCTRKKLYDFKNVEEAKKYYLNMMDDRQSDYTLRDKCSSCSYHKDNKCFGGCLGYKVHSILNN